MKRFHLFEIEDLKWCPSFLRNGITDFLQHIVIKFKLYQRVSLRLDNAIKLSKQTKVVDLCSGATGPWLSLVKNLKTDVHITLTDLHPNLKAFDLTQKTYPNKFNIYPIPVDATNVPHKLKGFRTLFSSFHHLPPEQAKAVLQDAVDKQSGIAIFESTQRHPLLILYMLITPILVLTITPLMASLNWKKLFFTYIIPLIPFLVMFDGIVSCIRTYTVKELSHMVASLNNGYEYHWEIGIETIGPLPVGVTYLIGYPIHE